MAVNWGTPTPATIRVVQIEPGPVRQPFEDFARAVNRDTELVFRLAGRNFRMGFRVDVGIYAQRDPRDLIF